MGEPSLMEDLETIIEYLTEAYYDAEADGLAMMTFTSMRGARFEGRVQRVQAAISDGTLLSSLQQQPGGEG